MEIATETPPTINTATTTIIPDGVATTKQEAERIKRGKGRPAKPFISELPVPSKFEMNKPEMLFDYLRSIPEDKLKRIMLVFYRYLPVCDETENGTKDKYLEKIPGESHPFTDDDWEKQVLHRYGSGIYGAYLNEMNRTICRCLKIETKWDLDNYPPNIDPQWVDQDHPQNRAFIQYLRSRGVKLPTQKDKEDEASEMQLADTVSQLTGALIARTTPVPQIPQQPSMSEKLSFEMASSAIDMFKEKAKVEMHANSQQNNGFELIDKFISVTDKMNPKNSGESTDFMKFLMQQQSEAQRAREAADARNNELMMKLFAQRDNAATQSKSLIEQMREMAEMRTLMKDAFGVGGTSDGEETTDKAETIPTMLIKNAPQLLQTGVQLFGQFNQSLALMTQMKGYEAMIKTGQLPEGVKPPTVPQPPQQQSQVQTPQPNGATPEVLTTPDINPKTGVAYTLEELDAIRIENQKYLQYHGFIAMLSQPMLMHLNDQEKDGYDFGEWFIAGQGRITYDQVKGIGPDVLLGAIKSYKPLWSQLGDGVEEKVKQFIGEFLTLDDMPDGDEGEES